MRPTQESAGGEADGVSQVLWSELASEEELYRGYSLYSTSYRNVEHTMPDVFCAVGEHRFEWDGDKSAKNERKHGVCFECAAPLWAKARERGYLSKDRLGKPDPETGEDRFITEQYGVFGPMEVEIGLKICYVVRRERDYRLLSCVVVQGKPASGVVAFCDKEYSSRRGRADGERTPPNVVCSGAENDCKRDVNRLAV